MEHVSLDKNARVTESMVMEAVCLAENGEVKQIDSQYEDSKLENAINALESNNSFSNSQKIEALKNVIDRRQKFMYVLYPIRKFLPKFLLKEVPMNFMDKDMKSFSFMDKITKKIKKI